jgi:23S rRNA (pseudouridine1915-N3)-methyltransferase
VRLVVVAVGTGQPRWVNEGFAEYARRLPRETPLELVAVRAESRTAGRTRPALLGTEAKRIEAAVPHGALRVALDERGRDLDTRALAALLGRWRQDGRDVAFLIGGPDGLDPTLKAAADSCIRLSSLTLPHGLARLMLAEALYRAASLLAGHPYHRE